MLLIELTSTTRPLGLLRGFVEAGLIGSVQKSDSTVSDLTWLP